ncbi:MAG: double-strand break repair protein AddB [Rhizomicrobium sp.]
MTANVFTIAAGMPFAQTLARGLIARLGAEQNPFALADAVVYLPTRRAVRTLGDTFARVSGGAALLPQLRALGDVDEDDDAFDPASDSISLPPAMAPLRRRLLLATLVRRWDRAKHGGRGQWAFAQAAQFARSLAAFLDEAETQEADLSKLEALAPANLAEHWAEVRDFLVLLRDEWPKLVAADGTLDPAARRKAQLDALTRRYAAKLPKGPVIAAGTTGSIPATARLLNAIAQLPNGMVILPGLDRALDEESWNKLDPGHPQFGMKELIGRIGIARADVKEWGDTPMQARAAALRETLRPAPTTDAWRAIAEHGADALAEGLEGLSLVVAAHPGEEATAIALVLRETLETEGKTAALVTPDRNLARRVAGELARWNIAIDDSAGRPLAHTPPGAFLLLLAEAVAQEFAPVPLLALLKHPLAAGGIAPAEFRRTARLLDRFCLRGPRPDPGLAGIRRAIANAEDGARRRGQDAHLAGLARWFDNVAKCLAPLCDALSKDEIAIADIVAAHAGAAEMLAASDTESGAARLWRGDAGIAAAELVAALQSEARDLPPIETASYAPLFRTLSEERAVRPAYGRHPRLAILGPLEARLQSFDVLVLGGLNEGTWPAAASADPWLSRPMRNTLGLASPERAIGLSAHDFATLAAGPRVILTRSLKAEGSPTVASRWLQRLVQLTKGLGLDERLADGKPYAALATLLEQPAPYAPERRPAPRPPVALRPRSLSVTEIETWLRDPYAIYAKHVLKLAPLEPLDAAIGPLERGTIVHRILELFLRETTEALPADAEQRLLALAERVFAENAIPNAALALWRPRFARAARWFVGMERARRSEIRQSFVELRGQRSFTGPAGEFVLRARADRIDVLKAGGGTIVDYKTGDPPSKKQVEELLSPQLPLEGTILAAGGFESVGKLAPADLIYIRFGGGADPGEERHIADVENLVRDAERKLTQRIAAFDDYDTPYLPRVMPVRRDAAGDYDHLARVLEWSLSGWQESGE